MIAHAQRSMASQDKVCMCHHFYIYIHTCIYIHIYTSMYICISIYAYINIFDSQRVPVFLFVPLPPFFYAAIAKCWKVQRSNGLRI